VTKPLSIVLRPLNHSSLAQLGRALVNLTWTRRAFTVQAACFTGAKR